MLCLPLISDLFACIGRRSKQMAGRIQRYQHSRRFLDCKVCEWWSPASDGSISDIGFGSDSWDSISTRKQNLDDLFGRDYTILYTLLGQSRPGNQAGHEHFGYLGECSHSPFTIFLTKAYLDGISQPALCGFQDHLPGQEVIPPGIILHGHPGDTAASTRPLWAIDGSFLVFRQLKQLVPVRMPLSTWGQMRC